MIKRSLQADMTLYLGYNSGDQFDGAVVVFAGQDDPRYGLAGIGNQQPHRPGIVRTMPARTLGVDSSRTELGGTSFFVALG
jgi:hypothetical protein